MKTTYKTIYLTVAFAVCTACSWLDIVPDNIATMDMVFKNRENAEKMLVTCYSYMPEHASPWSNPGLSSGDEIWNTDASNPYYTNKTSFNIAKGNQNVSDPYLNYWSGGQHGSNLFIAIRDCNTLIENIDRVPDMSDKEKSRWKAEAKVLKAFYHFWLLQLYGPIPFIDENIDVSASTEEVKVAREPVDDVIRKITVLLDEACSDDSLPDYIQVGASELGRLTKPAALCLKARVLMTAASPLFNGNEDFSFYKNAEGVNLINPVYDQTKWEIARDACKTAIDSCHSAGHSLYEFDEPIKGITDTTRLELTLRHTITERFNRELIWGLGKNGTMTLTGIVNPPLTAYQQGKQISWCKMMHNPTLGVAEQFYTKNGVPIDEDKTWDYENRYTVEKVPAGHEHYIERNARTAKLHFDREPRFYAWLGFDKGQWFNLEVPDDKSTYSVHCKYGETAGASMSNFSITGYFAKKLVSYELVMTESVHTGDEIEYAFPIIRLSDIYLLYAEALNECKEVPDDEVWEYIQYVRTKAGLDKETGRLTDTWEKYSNNPDAPKTKEGMREIIRRERLIELSFEGLRFHDLRRWKLCMDYLNRPIQGWNVYEKTDEEYYQPVYIHFREFTPKDYFWPIKLDDLYKNNKLVQSPLW